MGTASNDRLKYFLDNSGDQDAPHNPDVKYLYTEPRRNIAVEGATHGAAGAFAAPPQNKPYTSAPVADKSQFNTWAPGAASKEGYIDPRLPKASFVDTWDPERSDPTPEQLNEYFKICDAVQHITPQLAQIDIPCPGCPMPCFGPNGNRDEGMPNVYCEKCLDARGM